MYHALPYVGRLGLVFHIIKIPTSIVPWSKKFLLSNSENGSKVRKQLHGQDQNSSWKYEKLTIWYGKSWQLGTSKLDNWVPASKLDNWVSASSTALPARKFHLRQRETSLLTTYWPESTLSSWWSGGPASHHGSLSSHFQVALHLPF